MKTALVFALFVGLLVFPTAAIADGEPPWDFEFTANGGEVPDAGIGVFPLFMDPSPGSIVYLELEINGLSHPAPMDLDVYLIDPFGTTLAVMLDRGGQTAITDVDLVFTDKAVGYPSEPIISGTYLPEGPGGFFQFTNPGTDAWILLMIDDDADTLGNGGFDTYTLRGIPEPVTLTLLALGAIATLRRRRW